MGTLARRKPKRLANKLLEIRKAFGDSQNELIKRIGFTDEVSQSDISAFERGTREPPLYILLKYSELARVWVDVLIDDGLDLPAKLPSATKHTGLRRPASTRKGKRS